ncbi:MAG TPA: hypothetical protein VD905_21335 [Flavobacteriales bacterium]|nr:hypothetical protein [Flavobacteriales bacterium]
MLKFLHVASALFVSIIGFSQPDIKATKQDWTGGICCSGGTNYTVTITWGKNMLDQADITSVCLDGMIFQKEHLYISMNNTDSTTTIMIQMATRTDRNYRDFELLSKKKNKNACTETQIAYINGEYEGTIFIPGLTELFPIAYP